MNKLSVSWDGVRDTTGYLFSFAKALSAAVRHSPWQDMAEDIVASSGFAFRMWAADDLCPSAMSIWDFSRQKPWVESGGLSCGYIERLWGQEEIEEERRLTALSMIRDSIDRGIPAVSWDIGVPEWGLVIGYDDDTEKLEVLPVTGTEAEMDYALLGRRELPLLNVLVLTGRSAKSRRSIVDDTLRLALAHLSGEEWCDNAKGLAVYPSLQKHYEAGYNPDAAWNLEYYLGTYAALKWYAWKFLDKYGQDELASLYRGVQACWQRAFETQQSSDMTDPITRLSILSELREAESSERRAAELMAEILEAVTV